MRCRRQNSSKVIHADIGVTVARHRCLFTVEIHVGIKLIRKETTSTGVPSRRRHSDEMKFPNGDYFSLLNGRDKVGGVSYSRQLTNRASANDDTGCRAARRRLTCLPVSGMPRAPIRRRFINDNRGTRQSAASGACVHHR